MTFFYELYEARNQMNGCCEVRTIKSRKTALSVTGAVTFYNIVIFFKLEYNTLCLFYLEEISFTL